MKEIIKQPEPVPVKKPFEGVVLSEESESDLEVIDDKLIDLQEEPEGLKLNFSTVSAAMPDIGSNASNEISFDSLDINSAPAKEEISLKFTNVEVNSSVNNLTKKRALAPVF